MGGDSEPLLGDPTRAANMAGVTPGDLSLDDDQALTDLAKLAVKAASGMALTRTGGSWTDVDTAPAAVVIAVETAVANLLASAQLRSGLAHLPANSLGPVLREGLSDAFATPAVRDLLDSIPTPLAGFRATAIGSSQDDEG